jgi:hypothetical protein
VGNLETADSSLCSNDDLKQEAQLGLRLFSRFGKVFFTLSFSLAILEKSPAFVCCWIDCSCCGRGLTSLWHGSVSPNAILDGRTGGATMRIENIDEAFCFWQE